MRFRLINIDQADSLLNPSILRHPNSKRSLWSAVLEPRWIPFQAKALADGSTGTGCTLLRRRLHRSSFKGCLGNESIGLSGLGSGSNSRQGLGEISLLKIVSNQLSCGQDMRDESLFASNSLCLKDLVQ